VSAVCRVSIETRAHLEDQARREEDRTLPDFSYRECVREVVDADLVPAVTEIMNLLPAGKNGSHESLLRACAALERALLKKWMEA
jgi:hypothetical protein